MKNFDVVIVGAGHGGAQAAIALRQQGFAGTIAMIGAEPELPYERPALSKEYLAGEKPFERLLIRPAGLWRERNVETLLGRSVETVDAAGKQLSLSDGSTVGYGKLVWAAGGSPRRLSCSGFDLRGVHSIRNRSDVDRLVSELPDVRRAIVIGGGYIGLEAAAVLTKLGKQVVLLEALDRVLARVAGEPVSRFYEAEHRAHGVEVRTGAALSCIEETDGRATGVRIADGEFIPGELVIVGIGIVPAVAPLLHAGAEGGNGVDVDPMCRTSLPDIFAVGDCAAHLNPYAGGARVRLESVQNANDQASVAAAAICGRETAYSAVPWFWSNQYDLKLQTMGLSIGHDDLVVRGDPATQSFSVLYLRQGRLIACDAINLVRDYVQSKKLIEAGTLTNKAALADPAIPLKSFVATA